MLQRAHELLPAKSPRRQRAVRRHVEGTAVFSASPDATGLPLFVDDDELRRRLAPQVGRDRFRATIQVLERDRGFPPVNNLFRGRYWPAVKRWLDADQGVTGNACTGEAQDGQEDFDAAP